MGKIVLLDDVLANKIAAGEVVERPASVVKELVENAIDAGSTVIEILLESAGLGLIRIVDNGTGIAAEDVLTAFQRHATSKIMNEKDLFRVRTLGFRGEALPSIASVSKLELKTSTGDGAGTRVVIEGGKVIVHEGADSRQGTDIRVENLFYNTPARLKYLKSEATELGNITDVVNRLAISHPEIAFTLTHKGRQLLKTVGNRNLLQVFASIYGTDATKKMLPFSGESLDFQIEGLMGLPEMNRASRNYMTILVNGRSIKNFLVTKAILEGYHTVLPINRYPYVLLNITLDPYLVDVNVHPSKMEVRISKEPELMALITATIKAKLKEQVLIPAVEVVSKKTEKPVREQTSFQFEAPVKPAKKAIDYLVEQLHAPESEPIYVKENTPPLLVEEPSMSAPAISESTPVAATMPAMDLIGQLHGTYILAQNENGLYLIDQHAAQERIKYEFYKKKVEEVSTEMQQLLVPLTLEYSMDLFLRIQEQKETLAGVGIFLEEFGGNSFVVRETPTWFPRGEEIELIEALVEQVLALRKADIGKIREEAAITMSCKRSIKANRHLRNDEMQQLLEDLRFTSEPYTCPHGRPVVIQFTNYELEKMFKRVQ